MFSKCLRRLRMLNRETLLKKLRLTSSASDSEICSSYAKLKHTYELVSISSADEEIKKIAKSKLEDLERYMQFLPQVEVVSDSQGSEYDKTVKAAYKMLEKGKANEGELNEMLRKLLNTTMTSENYYLQTLLYLEINNGFPGCEYAKKTIENALQIEPQNHAYLALKNGIDSVIQAKINYDEEQIRIKQQQLREEEERRQRLEREARVQQTRACCGETATVICGIFACFCECFSSCCDGC